MGSELDSLLLSLSPFVAKAGLELLVILLPLSPQCWEHWHNLQHPATIPESSLASPFTIPNQPFLFSNITVEAQEPTSQSQIACWPMSPKSSTGLAPTGHSMALVMCLRDKNGEALLECNLASLPVYKATLSLPQLCLSQKTFLHKRSEV